MNRMNNSFEQQHYERPDLWDEEVWRHSRLDKQRALIAVRHLPVDVRSILDAGSGNGIFEQNSENHHWTVALDRSLEALRHIDAPRCQSDVKNTPFPDNSFDAVLSMEVIEHLPDENFKPTLFEFARLARRYILITVPYCEDLKQSQVRCPQCLYRFHRYYHQRSFDEIKLVSLFAPLTNITCVSVMGICEVNTVKFTSLWKIISHIIRQDRSYFPKNATCPRCGYQGHQPQDETIVPHTPSAYSKIKNLVKSNWPVHTTYEWWLAFYEKRETE